ncbi:excalibur calcium-binding domain-containing protein [Pseudonocardia sp. CA-107938]|uniref:excalibur calcium-binding domain-containing protein n=1 Tax=Pseudonocardia sp. CA-107938 TaxID=3240021 RepID=UPI003D939976
MPASVPVNGKTITAGVVIAFVAIGGACSSRESAAPRALSSPVTVTVTVPVYPSTTAAAPYTATPAPVTSSPARSSSPAARPVPLAAPDPDVDAPSRPAPANVYYKNCAAVQAAGAAPIRRGDPGYRPALDRDGDGEGCAGD